jgi:hypothetical protein
MPAWTILLGRQERETMSETRRESKRRKKTQANRTQTRTPPSPHQIYPAIRPTEVARAPPETTLTVCPP